MLNIKSPPKVNICLFGPSGIGKTTQCRTLDPETTLFIDMEAGDLAIQGWPGDRINVLAWAREAGVDPWIMVLAIASIIAGPDPSDIMVDPESGQQSPGPYSQAAYDSYCSLIDPKLFDKYDTIFLDSITQASRWSFDWTRRNDRDAFSEKTGKPDTRGAYGAHGRGGVRWLSVLQHQSKRAGAGAKNIIMVGILDENKDDLGRTVYQPQIVGGTMGRELPGIFDEVLTLMDVHDQQAGISGRAFICHKLNGYGVPAKDRSGRLSLYEPPDLGALVRKIQTAERNDGTIVTTLAPAPPEAQKRFSTQPEAAETQAA